MTTSTLPNECRAFLDAVAQGESDPTAKAEGISPYFILYGGGSFENMPARAGYSGFPSWSGKDNSHAAGRYQFEPATWLGIARSIRGADFTNPDHQDWGAWLLAKENYASRAGNLLSALQSGIVNNVGGILQPTWTSLSNLTFPARYAKALDAVIAGIATTWATGTVPVKSPTGTNTPTPLFFSSTPNGPLGSADVLAFQMRALHCTLIVLGYSKGPVTGKFEDMQAGLQTWATWIDGGTS